MDVKPLENEYYQVIGYDFADPSFAGKITLRKANFSNEGYLEIDPAELAGLRVPTASDKRSCSTNYMYLLLSVDKHYLDSQEKTEIEFSAELTYKSLYTNDRASTSTSTKMSYYSPQADVNGNRFWLDCSYSQQNKMPMGINILGNASFPIFVGGDATVYLPEYREEKKPYNIEYIENALFLGDGTRLTSDDYCLEKINLSSTALQFYFGDAEVDYSNGQLSYKNNVEAYVDDSYVKIELLSEQGEHMIVGTATLSVSSSGDYAYISSLELSSESVELGIEYKSNDIINLPGGYIGYRMTVTTTAPCVAFGDDDPMQTRHNGHYSDNSTYRIKPTERIKQYIANGNAENETVSLYAANTLCVYSASGELIGYEKSQDGYLYGYDSAPEPAKNDLLAKDVSDYGKEMAHSFCRLDMYKTNLSYSSRIRFEKYKNVLENE